MAKTGSGVLVFGRSGQVASHLHRLRGDSWALAQQRASSSQEPWTFVPKEQVNFMDLRALAEFLKSVNPRILINPSAYTQVDKAESDRESAALLNEHAPKVLAEFCASRGATLLHYSTDYVYPGSGEKPWNEEQAGSPLNYYGVTKLAGERAIAATGASHLILRTSWAYSAVGQNFLKTMLRLGQDRTELKVVADQIGAPTSAADLAAATVQLAERLLKGENFPRGAYNVASSGTTSWHGFASFIFQEARRRGMSLKVETVHPIPSKDYPTPAARPLNSRLSLEKSREILGISLPEWSQSVGSQIQEFIETQK